MLKVGVPATGGRLSWSHYGATTFQYAQGQSPYLLIELRLSKAWGSRLPTIATLAAVLAPVGQLQQKSDLAAEEE